MLHRMRVIDTHTGGEPTRVIVEGGPELGGGTLAQQRELMSREFDRYRTAILHEPRGSDVMVGAILTPPTNPACAAGVIFFNNVGYLNMCGHGTLGVGAALVHLDKISNGLHQLETPVGTIGLEVLPDNHFAVENVRSYRLAQNVEVEVPGEGKVRGEIAWGGNWFFLIGDHQERVEVANVKRLTEFTTRVKAALQRTGITGEDGAEIDHIEVFAPPTDPQNHSKNFVLCPGSAYDRSPCGTGTSAKIACLQADGKLQPGESWRQESIVGSLFEGSYRLDGAGQVVPRIVGTAYVNAETIIVLNDDDPFRWGIT